MTEIDVSNCTYYVEGECDIYQDKCDSIECTYKSYKRIEAQNRELKACLEDFNKPEGKKVLVYYHTGELDRLEEKCEALEQKNTKLKEALKSVREYFIVLKNIIPSEMLAEGSGVFGAINDAKKEIDEVLKDE